MLKEANDPTRQKDQRARTDADGPPLLAVDKRLVIPAGKVVKFIVTADDVIHSFAVPAFWLKQDANPGQLNETWAKVDRPGRLFRPVLGAVRRPPRASCRSRRSGAAGAVRRLGRFEGRHDAGAKPAAAATTAAPAAGMATPAPAVAGSARPTRRPPRKTRTSPIARPPTTNTQDQ